MPGPSADELCFRMFKGLIFKGDKGVQVMYTTNAGLDWTCSGTIYVLCITAFHDLSTTNYDDFFARCGTLVNSFHEEC